MTLNRTLCLTPQTQNSSRQMHNLTEYIYRKKTEHARVLTSPQQNLRRDKAPGDTPVLPGPQGGSFGADGWMRFWATWPSSRCPCRGVGTRRPLKVPANPNYFMKLCWSDSSVQHYFYHLRGKRVARQQKVAQLPQSVPLTYRTHRWGATRFSTFWSL